MLPIWYNEYKDFIENSQKKYLKEYFSNKKLNP
jgi:hypothetical protein